MPGIKLSDRERKLAFITLGVLIFYIFYQFLLIPQWNESLRLKEKARGQRLELKIAEGKINVLEAVEKRIGVIPEKTGMSRGEKALEVLKDISQATSRSGLNLILIKPMLEGNDAGLKFSLSCSGKYKNLYDFFVILRGLSKLILINNLDVAGGGDASPTLNIKMVLTAYY